MRRFIPKGVDIFKFSTIQTSKIQHLIDNYPGRILNILSAAMAVKNISLLIF